MYKIEKSYLENYNIKRNTIEFNKLMKIRLFSLEFVPIAQRVECLGYMSCTNTVASSNPSIRKIIYVSRLQMIFVFLQNGCLLLLVPIINRYFIEYLKLMSKFRTFVQIIKHTYSPIFLERPLMF